MFWIVIKNRQNIYDQSDNIKEKLDAIFLTYNLNHWGCFEIVMTMINRVVITIASALN